MSVQFCLGDNAQESKCKKQAFVAQPKVLLCDEPSMGLAQALLPQILTFLRRWAETGTAVVLVEQHLQITAPYADRAMIIERGKVKFECPAKDLDRWLAC